MGGKKGARKGAKAALYASTRRKKCVNIVKWNKTKNIRKELNLGSSEEYHALGDNPEPSSDQNIATPDTLPLFHSTPKKLPPSSLAIDPAVPGCSKDSVCDNVDPELSFSSVCHLTPQTLDISLDNSADQSWVPCGAALDPGNTSTSFTFGVLSRSVLEHEIPTEPSANEMDELHLAGRRLVDIEHLFHWTRNQNHKIGYNCGFKDMVLKKEHIKGFHCTWTFHCRMCNIDATLHSEDPQSKMMPVNDAAVHGTIAMGSGYSALSTLMSALNTPCMANNTFIQHQQGTVAKAIHNAAWMSMCSAAKEEIAIALDEGNVDKDGKPMCTVVADGMWCKRSYKTKYDSLSGVASIVGYRTRKVLFISIRNRYCCICARAKNLGTSPKEHLCFVNWNKSATSMEADIVAEGFLRSEEMHGLIYNKLIGDGDSSVHKRLTDIMPYGEDLLVEKVDCRNHLLRNYTNKLTALADQTKSGYYDDLRCQLRNSKMRMRSAITKAIEYRSTQQGNLQYRIKELISDIENGPYHVFGQHMKCPERGYFCDGVAKEGEVNQVSRMAECGLFGAIQKVVSSLTSKASSLICDVDNNAAETYNSIVNIFVGAKRINNALRGSYITRCEAAVVTFNAPGQYLRVVHQSMMQGQSPGKYTNKFVDVRTRRVQMARQWRKDHPNARRKRPSLVIAAPDEFYALNDSNNPFSGENAPDMDTLEREMAVRLVQLLKTRIERDELERRTVNQANCQEWKIERRKRLTASFFGLVCHLRLTTSCRNIVHAILYGTVLTKGMQHGNAFERVAKDQMALQHQIFTEDCGLFVDLDFPFLAASPDGLVVGEDAIMEVKCPSSAYECTTPEEAVTMKKITSCDFVDGKLILKPTHNYYYQVQGQLHITGRQYCYFVVYAKYWICFEKIEVDHDFWEKKMLGPLTTFYKECLLPEIVGQRYYKFRMNKKAIRDPPRIQKAIAELEGKKARVAAKKKSTSKLI